MLEIFSNIPEVSPETIRKIYPFFDKAVEKETIDIFDSIIKTVSAFAEIDVVTFKGLILPYNKVWEKTDETLFRRWINKLFIYSSFAAEVRFELNSYLKMIMNTFEYVPFDIEFGKIEYGLIRYINIAFRTIQLTSKYPEIITLKIFVETPASGDWRLKFQLFKLFVDEDNKYDWIQWTNFIYDKSKNNGRNFIQESEAFLLSDDVNKYGVKLSELVEKFETKTKCKIHLLAYSDVEHPNIPEPLTQSELDSIKKTLNKLSGQTLEDKFNQLQHIIKINSL